MNTLPACAQIFFKAVCGRTKKDYQRILRRNIAESGKAATELIPVWFRPVAPVVRLIVRAEPIGLVEDAERRERGVIYLTPHLGCFDAAALWAAQRRPITVLYRPPKMKALQPLIEAGRGRDRVQLAPANLGGVRLLLKALRRGEAVGILPDQVPGTGEGVWADFFGRPAYTMTLVGKLAQATGATILMAAAVRLPDGAGYAIHFTRIRRTGKRGKQCPRLQRSDRAHGEAGAGPIPLELQPLQGACGRSSA